MALDEAQQNKISDLRRRVLAGETPTREELREIFSIIRESRAAAATRSAPTAVTRARKPAVAVNLDDLFAGTGGGEGPK